MSYDIFFVRRDPGQTFEDALQDVEDSYEGGDPGPLTDTDLEVWDALLERARDVLGPRVEVRDEGDETRELTDPVTGIGLTFFQGEFEIHVPNNLPGSDDLELMSTVYELAREVEEVTGLEGYDPQLSEPISDTSDVSPTRRQWDDDEEDDGPAGAPVPRPVSGTVTPEPFASVNPAARPARWWEFWKQ
jgi:hypothetical protein